MLVKKYHYNRLRDKEKKFIDDVIDGLDGTGEINDFNVKDYITPGQEMFVRNIGKRFLISKETKV